MAIGVSHLVSLSEADVVSVVEVNEGAAAVTAGDSKPIPDSLSCEEIAVKHRKTGSEELCDVNNVKFCVPGILPFFYTTF